MALAALPLMSDAFNPHTGHNHLMRVNKADGHHFEKQAA
jgi:hypothetical protein